MLTKTQRSSLERLLKEPLFPSPRYHRTYKTLTRLGFAELITRFIDGRTDAGWKITEKGRTEIEERVTCADEASRAET